MSREEDRQDRLYGIGIESFDHKLYEIVLPGRSHHHARKAAEILMGATGTRAFEPFDLLAAEPAFLSAAYRSALPRILPCLFSAYELLSHARRELRAEPDLFEALEYQIDHARGLLRPAPKQLREYLKHRAITRLPSQIGPAHPVLRPPANKFEPASKLAGKTASAAAAFSRSIEKDAQEVAALKTRIQTEHRLARTAISQAARSRCAALRHQINAAFADHYKALKIPPGGLAAEPGHGMISIGTLARESLRKATVKAHQQALRTAIRPVIAEKRAALAQADQLRDQFHKTDRALTLSATTDLQRQWRVFAADHDRQIHGPAATPLAPEQKRLEFLERLGARAGQLRPQSPAREQNNLPEPD
ncbi:MAG: hypothetical protein B7Y80_17605 [Hyphomicrobium sp. 32-62-53]|nr:MAG: hypothetical protein B7Y80_17605 [Hyphomicrobium sp. 32-62-53]